MLHARVHPRLDAIEAAAWDALVADDNPFVSHAFLAGLERHGCLSPEYGWQPHHLGLYAAERLVAAAPLYLKGNSHGEFVFDWSWAAAYERHGLDYYPKLLAGVPYSPVTGPRLLAGRGEDAAALRRALAGSIERETDRLGLSSAHANFVDDEDAAALADAGWLARGDWQFHWHNRGWRDFEDFLAALASKKRKNIRHERAQVARAGIRCTPMHGGELDEATWDAVHRLYRRTFDAHGNYAALTPAFFRHLGRALPTRSIVVLCRHGAELIAMALFLRSADTLYGRYWGADAEVPGLHFEACYYQGIDYCLREGLSRFEPGAQGEHKVARGFLPVATRSYHHLVDGRFRAAVADALQRERDLLDRYRDDVLVHSPYTAPP
ncbi:MAG TPA: GNAT family N-acetyltransferase [Dokdonella sp.]|uniref:GNAT family N-acetyltransferase n=1 Tax=Dokdonella sp. TaxID=2291710 RepID=UPI002D007C6C|nr:GNAT family N-acetyltransferase [Dokdonella sp.]HUD40416.1 GNAT family N-acetyltransferase [Dokdonella sp.]